MIFRCHNQARLLGLILVVSLLVGCSTGFQNVTVLKQVPPHSHDVEIVIDGPAPVGRAVFSGDYKVTGNPGGNFSNTSPTQEQIEDIRKVAAQHGADVVVIKCAAPGTVGAGTCAVTGYTSSS